MNERNYSANVKETENTNKEGKTIGTASQARVAKHYVVDIATGLVMSRDEFLSWNRD